MALPFWFGAIHKVRIQVRAIHSLVKRCTRGEGRQIFGVSKLMYFMDGPLIMKTEKNFT